MAVTPPDVVEMSSQVSSRSTKWNNSGLECLKRADMDRVRGGREIPEMRCVDVKVKMKMKESRLVGESE